MTATHKQPEMTIQQLQCIKKATDSVLHRIQNELSGSQTLMTLMDREVLDKSSEKEALHRVNSAFNKLLNICSGYERLSLRYDEPFVSRQISVSLLIGTILHEHAGMIEDKHAGVDVNIADDMVCEFDSSKLHTVCSHLIKNYLSYAHAGSRLRIWTENHPLFIEFHFSDNGPGIPVELEKDLFNDVVLKRESGGDIHLGFGLLSSALLLRSNGGDITLQSNTNQGTHIRFCIPEQGSSRHG